MLPRGMGIRKHEVTGFTSCWADLDLRCRKLVGIWQTAPSVHLEHWFCCYDDHVIGILVQCILNRHLIICFALEFLKE